jgi:hypothetical protein
VSLDMGHHYANALHIRALSHGLKH